VISITVGVQAEASGEKDACTNEPSVKLNGAINGELQGTVQGVIAHPNVLKVYGGFKTGASGGVECTNGNGKWYAKWNGLSFVGGYTIGGFIDKNLSYKIFDDVPLGESPFSCELPF
jgi:hypothetical protein